VAKNFPSIAEALVKQHGFDINLPRSDQCTPMHLAIFYRKPDMAAKLQELGADLSLKNNYGDACDEKFQKLAEARENIIFLDLELTKGFYDLGLSQNRGADKQSENVQRILEIAIIVTNKNLEELGRKAWVIGGFSKASLDELPDFHQNNFRDPESAGDAGQFPRRKRRRVEGAGAPQAAPQEGGEDLTPYGNGLFADMLDEAKTKPLPLVEREVLKFLNEHCVERASVLAGNSIQCDREVLRFEMPAVYEYLHHQILDVSSLLGAAARWAPRAYAAWKSAMASNKAVSYNHRAMNDCESSVASMQWIRGNLLAQPEADQGAKAADDKA